MHRLSKFYQLANCMMGESQECMEDQPSIGGKDPEPETSKKPKLCLRFTNRTSKNTKGKTYQGSLWLNQNRLIPRSNRHFCWFEHHLSSFNYLSCGASSCIVTKKRNETYFQNGTSMMRFPLYFPLYFQRNFSAFFLGLLWRSQDTFDPDRFIERCGWKWQEPTIWMELQWVFTAFDVDGYHLMIAVTHNHNQVWRKLE